MLTVSWVDLISWFLTVVSVLLFIIERRKNDRLPYYMAIQGILRACKTRAGFYASYRSKIERSDSKSFPKDEVLLLAEGAYTDYSTLMEHIMGSLKAIEPNKDMPFDPMEFTKPKIE